MELKARRVKYACYSTNIAMAVVANLSPLLFLTFHDLYDISFSLLGLLVLVNFVTQLTVDLIFSFFSHRFNIEKAVRLIPVITFVGLLLYALAPVIFPNNVYLGLLLGTVIFSAASGFGEVLISPVIAALPAENPEHEMSKLHSVYAWGSVFVIIFSTLFLLLLGRTSWQWLAVAFLSVPLASLVLFSGTALPKMETPERVSGALQLLRKGALWLCIFAIFLGGAAECTMAQWSSGYLEQALGIPKIWGDIFGVALFSVMMGIGRSLYAKCGKRIERVLLLGAIGATLCYLTAALAGIPVIALVACALTGICVSMLWPGSLIVASEKFPSGGVFIYAMMAAGGDLGASVGPQLVGLVTDAALVNPTLLSLAERLALAPEQLGMKLSMLVGAIFPLLAIAVYAVFYFFKKRTSR